MSNLANKWIIVQAYKHNGELHRQWSHSFVVVDDEDYFIVVSVRSSVIENDGRKWHTKEPAVFIMPKKKWFNVIAMMKESGIAYYVNIASPTIFDKKYLKYIDYDLDIKLFSDGSTKLLDEFEYKKHASEQGYSDTIKQKLFDSVNEVYELIKNKNFPFVDKEILKLFRSFERRTKLSD